MVKIILGGYVFSSSINQVQENQYSGNKFQKVNNIIVELWNNKN